MPHAPPHRTVSTHFGDSSDADTPPQLIHRRSTRLALSTSTMPTPILIHAHPFKSSHLAIPPSPISPRSPLFPQARERPTPTPLPSSLHAASTPPPPPPPPVAWLWQCHLCNRVYRLGTTRRCLDDGHFFCSGPPAINPALPPARKRRRPRGSRGGACASEFDYVGYKAWAVWRRHYARPAAAPARDCWRLCDYPSHCRWGSRYGVASPVRTTFDDILMDMEGGGPEEEALHAEAETETEMETPDAMMPGHGLGIDLAGLQLQPRDEGDAATAMEGLDEDDHDDDDGTDHDDERDVAVTHRALLDPSAPPTIEKPTPCVLVDDLWDSARRRRKSWGALGRGAPVDCSPLSAVESVE